MESRVMPDRTPMCPHCEVKLERITTNTTSGPKYTWGCLTCKREFNPPLQQSA
jgi:hypothetical protein